MYRLYCIRYVLTYGFFQVNFRNFLLFVTLIYNKQNNSLNPDLKNKI